MVLAMTETLGASPPDPQCPPRTQGGDNTRPYDDNKRRERESSRLKQKKERSKH